MDIDNASELRAMQAAGRKAFVEGSPRRAPRGLLLDEGEAWYRGYDGQSEAALEDANRRTDLWRRIAEDRLETIDGYRRVLGYT